MSPDVRNVGGGDRYFHHPQDSFPEDGIPSASPTGALWGSDAESGFSQTTSPRGAKRSQSPANQRAHGDLLVQAILRYEQARASGDTSTSVSEFAQAIAGELGLTLPVEDINQAYRALQSGVSQRFGPLPMTTEQARERAELAGDPNLAPVFLHLSSQGKDVSAPAAEVVLPQQGWRRLLGGGRGGKSEAAVPAGAGDPRLNQQIEHSLGLIQSIKDNVRHGALSRSTEEALRIMSQVLNDYREHRILSPAARQRTYRECNRAEVVAGFQELASTFPEQWPQFHRIYQTAVEIAFAPAPGQTLAPAEALDIASSGIGSVVPEQSRATLAQAQRALATLSPNPSLEERRQLATLAAELHWLPLGSAASERSHTEAVMASHLYPKLDGVKAHLMDLALAEPRGEGLSPVDRLGVFMHGAMTVANLETPRRQERLAAHLRLFEATSEGRPALPSEERGRQATDLIRDLAHWTSTLGVGGEYLQQWTEAIDEVTFPRSSLADWSREETRELAILLRERSRDATIGIHSDHFQHMSEILQSRNPTRQEVRIFSEIVLNPPEGTERTSALFAALLELVNGLDRLAQSGRA